MCERVCYVSVRGMACEMCVSVRGCGVSVRGCGVTNCVDTCHVSLVCTVQGSRHLCL